MELAGARALVTAGSHRLGGAIAVGLAAHGADVAIGYRSSAVRAEATLRAIRSHGVTATAIEADVASVAAARRLVDEAVGALGGLDILVNSASGGFAARDPEEIDEQLFDAAVGSTFKGSFFCAQAARLAMGETGGVIINITDVAGLEGWPRFAVHGAAKAALMHLTKVLAQAWAPTVRVCSVAPGPVLLPDDVGSDSQSRSADETLLGRVGSPDDVVDAVIYLLRADFVTGAQLVVDGGHLHR